MNSAERAHAISDWELAECVGADQRRRDGGGALCHAFAPVNVEDDFWQPRETTPVGCVEKGHADSPIFAQMSRESVQVSSQFVARTCSLERPHHAVTTALLRVLSYGDFLGNGLRWLLNAGCTKVASGVGWRATTPCGHHRDWCSILAGLKFVPTILSADRVIARVFGWLFKPGQVMS